MDRLSRRGVLAGSAALASLWPSASRAQAWPERPVTLIVPYGPGASNDIFTRALGDGLSRRTGQSFIVDNRPGAGGVTGLSVVSRAKPDGYVLLEMPNSIVGLKPVLHVAADPLTDLTPIAAFGSSPTALVVPSALPVKTAAEFVAYAKARPTALFYGFAGIGTTQQQHMELFNQLTGTRIKGVNYKSSADAQTDLLAGRLQAMFVTVASTSGQIKSGDLRLLAYTDGNYPADAPHAPTMAEAGIEGMAKAQIWWGVFGPPGMAENLVGSINAAINGVVGTQDFSALLARSGATPMPRSPSQFAAMIYGDQATMEEFLRANPAGK